LTNAAFPEEIRIGIAGLGFGRDVHLPAFRSISGVRVTGLLGANRERASKAAEETGLPVVVEQERWFDLGFDAISVALPPVEIEQVCRAALARGLPVLAEKPLGPDGRAAHALAGAAAGRPNAVDFEFAELQTFRDLRAVLQDALVGEVRHLTITWFAQSWAHRRRVPSWKLDAARAGGVLNLFVTHLFFMLDELLPEVEQVSARLDCRATASICGEADVPAEDLAHVMMEHRGGAVSSITCSNSTPGTFMHRWVVVCERGTVVFENSSRDDISAFTLTVLSGTGDVIRRSAEPRADGDGRIPLFRRIAERFVAAVRDGGECRPDFAAAARVADLVDAARRSAASGLWIEAPRLPHPDSKTRFVPVGRIDAR
jgi:predicted dehydrogenase